MNNWQESLQQFLNNNPDLSEGDVAPAVEDAAPAKTSSPRLDIIFERKGRAGKQATIIAGFPEEMPDDEIADIARRLKQLMGTGGSARGGEILIQGDRRADAERHLQAMGFKTRRCN